MEKFFEKLGLYEIINYLFTAIITYVSFVYLLYYFEIINKANLTTYIGYIKDWYYLIIIYFFGIIIHEGSEFFSKWIFFHKGYPSDRYFEENKHSKIKEQISTKINKDRDIKFDLNESTDLKQAFNIIYSIMQETPANEMIQKMNRQFGCFRALSFVFILETVISIVLLIRDFILEGFNLEIFKIFIPLVIISWLSIRRMYRFGNRFADYCYRNYARDIK